MKTSSCKAKGRRAALEVKDLLYHYAPDLKVGDIEVTSSSVPGCDLQLSPAARLIYPLSIEVKNQESVSIWKAYAQAKEHAKADEAKGLLHFPVVFFRRNRSELLVCLSAEHLMKLIR